MSPLELSEAFCTYCGHPPPGTLQRASRICKRCKLGMVLSAPSGEAPQISDPFLIIDNMLTVQAISHLAEPMLGVNEPDVVTALFDELLQPANGILGRPDLALLLRVAAAGSPPSGKLVLRAAGRPQRRFRARVTSCGQPPAALVVLAPLNDPPRHRRSDQARSGWSNGRAAAHAGHTRSRAG